MPARVPAWTLYTATDRMVIGSRLRELRAKTRLVERAALEPNRRELPVERITSFEQGYARVRAPTLAKIAHILDAPIPTFL